MERCVYKHLFNYIQKNQLLTPFQSSFIQGDSTTFQLLHTYHAFCEAVDAGKEVRGVFCDISKAFDRVWHSGLLYKLSKIGCSDHVIKWFSSYLSNRRQCVILSGTISEWASVYAGTLQGSILGPLLFLIFINNIVKNIKSSIHRFAENTRKGKRKVQGVPQSQMAALPRHQKETDKTKQAPVEQRYEKL